MQNHNKHYTAQRLFILSQVYGMKSRVYFICSVG